ncbi:hypothetical protein QJS04_geneDACA021684 [Acorus gramineus]|uniref:Bifunctional inhibitor/plant lipid transfer protein/seed storage helical domain-containing protein n=1 Tax=Acorus gramineus TaxID=55184 RepID=A0AAV9A1F6_ACOGR|nr:hypothetical protein QJS04_geneDACA021684 [Acorus gramineus]
MVAMAHAFTGLARAQQVSCPAVDSVISTCGSYLTGQVTVPSDACCGGVRSIHQAAGDSAHARRETCECIRRTVAMYSDLSDEAARALTGECGVKAGIPIARDVDCSR